MARDTITIKLTLEADFDTIQGLRRSLASAPTRESWEQLLTQQATTFLSAYHLTPLALTASTIISRCSEIKKGSTPPPLVKENQLILWDHELNQLIETLQVGEPYWLDWLEQLLTKSFRYESVTGTFTAIKENRRGRPIWYAHRRVGGKLKRVYLGKSENLTRAKLVETARKLGQA
jgi:hypothetical protein